MTKLERIQQEIRRRAALFCCDNMTLIGKVHEIETAMMIGASIVLEQPITDDEDLPMTKEGEELIRQLFEGPPVTPEQMRATYLEAKA